MNFLKYTILQAIFIGISVCQLNTMSRIYQMPTFKKERISQAKMANRKAAFERLRRNNNIAKGIASLTPNQFFVHEQHTGIGVNVDDEIIQLSRHWKQMLEDIPDLDKHQRSFPITYSINTLQSIISLAKDCSELKNETDKPGFKDKAKVIGKRILKKIEDFSMEQVVEFCNMYSTMGFQLGQDCDEFISGLLNGRIIVELLDLINEGISLAIYALCDIKYISKSALKYAIWCDTKIDILAKFKTFSDRCKSSILHKLDQLLQYHILRDFIQKAGLFEEMRVIKQEWGNLYTQLKSARNISDFLDILQKMVNTEIDNRLKRDEQKYIAEQNKLWFWQQDR